MLKYSPARHIHPSRADIALAPAPAQPRPVPAAGPSSQMAGIKQNPAVPSAGKNQGLKVSISELGELQCGWNIILSLSSREYYCGCHLFVLLFSPVLL